MTYTDIIVSVHGIGAQSRNSTVRSVATRLAASAVLTEPSTSGAGTVTQPLAPQPLGYFHTDVQGAVNISPLDVGLVHPLDGIGFTEVFWADIPQDVVKEGRTLEETKAWARTVVARARRAFFSSGQTNLRPPDFSMASEVLEEIIETIHVIENLTYLASKLGLPKFKLKEVLDEFLGDVQIMTEFTYFRRDIIGRFHAAMEQIHNNHPDARIHIVAHSEGTVVSFLGLLHAFCGTRILPANRLGGPLAVPSKDPEKWLNKVRGFMTLGSPIDKHILLWPEIFTSLRPRNALRSSQSPIKWRNYYDYADPVGFRLETTRLWLNRAPHFEFRDEHDIGFARYLLPGAAHNEYWKDPEVFEHFIADVVAPKKHFDPAKLKPATRPLVYVFSPLLPYLLSFLLVTVGVFILCKAVDGFVHPELDPLQKYVRFQMIGAAPPEGLSRPQMLLNSLGIAGLLAGVTLAARIPRLARDFASRLWSVIAFALGCLAYAWAVDPNSQQEIGYVFTSPLGFNSGAQPWWRDPAVLGILLTALLVALVGYFATQRGKRGEHAPRFWLFRGMRPLMLCGGVALTFFVAANIAPHHLGLNREIPDIYAVRLTADQQSVVKKARLQGKEIEALFLPPTDPQTLDKRLRAVSDVGDMRTPVWPVLLAISVSIYLWWLATLIFDLGFVWNRYVRNAVAQKTLTKWKYPEANLQTPVPATKREPTIVGEPKE